uniref:Uncharacterized protein n=1 Tax=Anguilla anguilla TaxID=7936 RepID=A0A0E9S5H4_ANGAN
MKWYRYSSFKFILDS